MKIARILAYWFLFSFIAYLLFAFSLLESNPIRWNYEDRSMYAILSGIILFILILAQTLHRFLK